MAHGDDHVLALDQVLDLGLELDILDRRAPGIGELRLDRQEFAAQHFNGGPFPSPRDWRSHVVTAFA
jgi:hypothetical protein